MRFAQPIRFIPVFLAFGFLMSLPAARADQARNYEWLTAGKVSGSLVTVVREDGARVSDFEFNDRGRGPAIHEVIETGDDGMIVSLEISGHSYMGAPVDERFHVKDGVAEWQSTFDKGQAGAGQFYWASEGTFEQYAILARALLADGNGQQNLLPSGKASIREIATHENVTLYGIDGLYLVPQYFWLDQEQELFAAALGGMGLVRQGYRDVLPVLQEIQDKEERSWQLKQSAALTHKLPANWIIRNVSVLDVESGTLRKDQMIAVIDGRIVRVVDDTGLNLPVYGDMEPRIIDGQGLTLIPGLWDMHTHMSSDDGLLHIAAGVTHVRDLGNNPPRLAEIRAAFDDGQVIGPRSTAAGFIDGQSPYSAPTPNLVETLEEALVFVREFAAAGVPQVKIYSSMDPAWVKPLASEIHGQGMRLSGHIPSSMTAQQAVNDGFDEIQHINMLFLNFLAGPEDDTRTPLRFTLVAEKAGDMDLESGPVMQFIALLKDRGVVIDPTVSIFDSMFRHRSGEPDPSYAMIEEHLPAAVRRGMLAGELDITDANAGPYARSADALLAMIAKLHAAGVPLVAGTDGLAGFTLHRELELYRQAGISNADVLRIATINSAGIAGKAADSGSITVGKQADFVLLAANPLEDINAIRRPVAVFKGDRWYDPAQIYEALGIRPFTR